MTTDPTNTRHIGILLFDDVEELDAVGPWEVLSAWTTFYPQDGWTVSCLSSDGGTVRCAKGLVIGAHHSYTDAPPMDVFIHPGGKGTRPMLTNAEHLAWVTEQRVTVPLMTSVCSGSLVYAAAGMLHDRPATTHWAAVPELAALDPSTRIDETARWVDDGDVITSAGVSAGIDMALYLVARLVSDDRARDVQRYIQYDHGPYPQPSTAGMRT
jgi:transcriptional regulator GlxA family with amidase domain